MKKKEEKNKEDSIKAILIERERPPKGEIIIMTGNPTTIEEYAQRLLASRRPPKQIH